jgi:thioredoxin-related protein
MSCPPVRRAVTATRAILLVALLWLGGCEIHDETVQTLAPSRSWRASSESTGRRDTLGTEPTAGTRIEYVEGYDAGRRRATAGGLPMLLVFRASWCRWSGELTKGPLTDRDLVILSRRFVCVTIDADRDTSTCATFGVSGFPTVILVDQEGQPRFRATGSLTPDRLTVAMHDVLGDSARSQRVAAGQADDTRR